MKDLGAALASGLRAPWRRWRYVLLLWLARLVPILLVFGAPLYDEIVSRSARHPDAGRLLAPAADTDGFAYQWTSDLFRDGGVASPDTQFWVIVVAWVLVAFFAGGITARFMYGEAGLFLAECGRYAGRFLRLLVVAAVAVYLCDLALNSVLAAKHDESARAHHTQDFAVRKSIGRGVLFVALVYLVGVVHSYARIEIVAHERRSALLAFLRGIGTLLTRFPKLLALELVMLLAAGVAALIAYGLLRAAAVEPDATWTGVSAFVVVALVGSYLRSGVELGTLEARCRLLAAPVAVITSSQPETPAPPEDESGDLLVPPG